MNDKAKAWIRKHLSEEKLHRGLKIATKALDTATRLTKVASPLGAAAVLTQVTSLYLEDKKKDPVPDPYQSWCLDEDLSSCQVAIYSLLEQSGRVETDLNISKKQREIFKSKKVCLNGVDVVFYADVKPFKIPRWKHEEDRGKVRAAIRDLFWETYGKAILLSRPLSEDYPGRVTLLSSDPFEEVLPSIRAQQVWEDTEPFLRKGYSRALMFYGPPGTGKSHIMRRLAQLAGGYSLRLDMTYFSSSELKAVFSVLSFLQPKVILLDDLDRCERVEECLSFFEMFKLRVPLILSSVNMLSAMDPAILRPGRFDEIIEVRDPSPDVVDLLLQEVPDHLKDRMKAVPLAYINEFRRRAEIWGMEKAVQSLEELLNRLQHATAKECYPKSPLATP